MYRTFIAFLALAIVLVASQAALADSGLVQGSILNIDVLGNRVHVIQPDGKVFVFLRTSETIVTLNGKPYAFELLQTGWKVSVQFNKRTKVALRIDAFNV